MQSRVPAKRHRNDAHVVGAFLDTLSPAEPDLYGKAAASLDRDKDQLQQAQRKQIERLRYQARLAEPRYNQTDPDNLLEISLIF
jgi:hypothetical protein